MGILEGIAWLSILVGIPCGLLFLWGRVTAHRFMGLPSFLVAVVGGSSVLAIGSSVVFVVAGVLGDWEAFLVDPKSVVRSALLLMLYFAANLAVIVGPLALIALAAGYASGRDRAGVQDGGSQ